MCAALSLSSVFYLLSLVAQFLGCFSLWLTVSIYYPNIIIYTLGNILHTHTQVGARYYYTGLTMCIELGVYITFSMYNKNDDDNNDDDENDGNSDDDVFFRFAFQQLFVFSFCLRIIYSLFSFRTSGCLFTFYNLPPISGRLFCCSDSRAQCLRTNFDLSATSVFANRVPTLRVCCIQFIGCLVACCSSVGSYCC